MHGQYYIVTVVGHYSPKNNAFTFDPNKYFRTFYSDPKTCCDSGFHAEYNHYRMETKCLGFYVTWKKIFWVSIYIKNSLCQNNIN